MNNVTSYSCWILLFLVVPVCVHGQSAQAVMEVKVEVVTGTNSQLLKTIIATPQKSIRNNIDNSLFSVDSSELIEKEGLLLYKIDSNPNRKLLVDVDTIQRFDKGTDKEVIFIIHAVGYSYTPDRASITYFDNVECNSLATNNEGEVYLWVDGHFFFPELMEGKFNKNVEFESLKCEEL